MLLPAARLWLVWSETAIYATATIGLRLTSVATAFWLRGQLPSLEVYRMISEKQLAAFEAMSAVGAATLRRPGKFDPLDLAMAAVAPYRTRTRANVGRLRRRALYERLAHRYERGSS